MATLTKQTIPLAAAGAVVTYAAVAAGGDQFANPDGRIHLRIENTSGSDRTVTVASNTNCNQGFDHDIAMVVTTATIEEIGPFPTDRFNDASGFVQLTYSDSGAGVAAAVVEQLDRG